MTIGSNTQTMIRTIAERVNMLAAKARMPLRNKTNPSNPPICASLNSRSHDVHDVHMSVANRSVVMVTDGYQVGCSDTADVIRLTFVHRENS